MKGITIDNKDFEKQFRHKLDIELMTLKELEKNTGVSYGTFYKIINNGVISKPIYKKLTKKGFIIKLK